jgi:NAD(P)-dependent dehydrogenase (short-subunit alcohol dehydrogenase family)
MELAQGRKALITGGASGFGREIARRLHEAGAATAIVDINAAEAERVASELGSNVLGLGADVRSPEQTQAAVDAAAGEFGGLDTVVVSAGVFHMRGLEDTTEEEWDRTLDVNLKGAFLTARASSPHLRASGRGRLVMVSSDAGKRGFSMIAPYTASKFGMIGLAESVAAELAAENVTVNCVCPVGCPTTGMGQQVLEEKIARVGRSAEEIKAAAALTNPIGRNATEADVADAVIFFCSEHASFLTGVALDVDGGASLGSVPGTND